MNLPPKKKIQKYVKTNFLKDCICSIKWCSDGCGKRITHCCVLKPHIKQLLILLKSKISQTGEIWHTSMSNAW